MDDRIAISAVRLDGGTQSRARLDDDRVAQYVDAIVRGDTMPPVEVFFDGSSYWLWDGFHRVEAHARAGQVEVAARVRSGTVDDAVWQSLAANKDHDKAGKPRSRADVQRSIERALRHPRGAKTSNGEIAVHIGCDPKTVNVVRGRLVASQEIPEMKTRTVERNGVTYEQNTANIGKRPSAVAAPPRHERAPVEQYEDSDRDDGAGLVVVPDAPAPTVAAERAGFGGADVASSMVRLMRATDAFAREVRDVFGKADGRFAAELRERAQDTLLRAVEVTREFLPPTAGAQKPAFGIIRGGKS